MTTLLGRAKGSPLDVTFRNAPTGTIDLLSPNAPQIRTLELETRFFLDVVRFSELGSGQFPLLHTLKINSPLETHNRAGRPHVVNLPTPPLFGGSVHLERFVFTSGRIQCLSKFVFPNLTSFELSSDPKEFVNVLFLLDFLKTSPMLQTVKMVINANVTLPMGCRGEKTAVVLPNVETFFLCVEDVNASNSYALTDVYDIATRISCPRAKRTSLHQKIIDQNITPRDLGGRILPSSWDEIAPLYPVNPVEEVTLKIRIRYANSGNTTCSLIFLSSNATAFVFFYEAHETVGYGWPDDIELEDISWGAFSQACRLIQNHPLVSHLRRLHIEFMSPLGIPQQVLEAANDVRELFSSLGPLDELTIRGCDLNMFVACFLNHLVFDWTMLTDPSFSPQIIFPQVEELL